MGKSSSAAALVYPLIAMMLISLLYVIVVIPEEREKQYVYAATAKTTAAPSLANFNFAAAGDWACNSNTTNTVSNIVDKNPKLVLGLGDYYYSHYNESRSADCWFKIIKSIEQRIKISIGNHEDDSPLLLSLFMNHFNLTKQYYSFSYQNVHFVVISTELPINIGSEQYNFVNTDLAKAASDPNINWIIIYYHKTAYTSPSLVNPFNAFRDIYHPIFDKYHVDLVLQAHEHNYQRSYPMKYNSLNPSKPIITDSSTTNIHNNYANPQGRIFAIVGTAGAHLFKLSGQAPYMATQYMGHGFLDVAVINNGTTLSAKFYANDEGTVKDQFTITKSIIVRK
jgi:hypothetical protein